MKKAYLRDGKAVSVVSTITDDGDGSIRYLVSDIVYVYDGYGECFEDSSETNMYFVSKIFDDPPIAIQNEKVLQLKNEISELEEKERFIKDLVRKLEKQHKELEEKSKKFSPLENVFDFIDEKITHYVMNEHGKIKILDFNDTEAEYARNCEKRLLSLYGNSNGDLSWKLNRYSDGSGTWATVVPCTSYEMAFEEAQKCLDESLLEASNYSSFYLINSAKKYGLNIPEEFIEKYRNAWKKNHDENVLDLKNKYNAEKNMTCDID